MQVFVYNSTLNLAKTFVLMNCSSQLTTDLSLKCWLTLRHISHWDVWIFLSFEHKLCFTMSYNPVYCNFLFTSFTWLSSKLVVKHKHGWPCQKSCLPTTAQLLWFPPFVHNHGGMLISWTHNLEQFYSSVQQILNRKTQYVKCIGPRNATKMSSCRHKCLKLECADCSNVQSI